MDREELITVAEIPYSPSWIDRFTDWLYSLNLPYLVVIFLLYVLIVMVNHLQTWITGEIAWGTFSYELFAYTLFTAEVLYFLKFIDKDAERALDEFRPLLSFDRDEVKNLLYRLKVLPARPVLIVTAIGILLGVYMGYSTEIYLTGSIELSVAGLFSVMGFVVPNTLALIFLYRMILQMRIVYQLYASVAELDLYNLSPVYALSTHTAKISFILVFMVYSNLFLVPGSIGVPSTLVTTIVISILSFIAFLLPLRGVNRRLVSEKLDLLSSVNARIKEAYTRLEFDFDNSNFAEMETLGRALSNLQSQKAYIESIPTWPWRPAALRGFLSAMVLPIVIWLVQQVLDRMLLL